MSTDTRPANTDDRRYLATHPWLTFNFDLDRLHPRFWTSMGAAQSKCLHISGTPMKPELAERLHITALTKGALSTTAIEGNTLSEEQVERAVRGELEVPASQEYLKREAENVIGAFNKLERNLIGESGSFVLSVELLDELNRALLDGLELPDDIVAGEVRTISVGVGNYRGAPAEDCVFLLECLSDWINGPALRPDQENENPMDWFYCAFIRATLAHLYLAWIHPYGDGNGRLARLVEFAILIDAGIPLTAAHLLSQHYNITRTRYYTRLDESSRVDDSIAGAARFMGYAAEGFVDQLALQIADISKAVFESLWCEYVYDTLPAKTETQRRRRQVALVIASDLQPRAEWTRRNDLALLTPKLAELYAGKGPKTVTRDINALEKSGYVVRFGPRLAARRSQLVRTRPRVRATEHSPLS